MCDKPGCSEKRIYTTQLIESDWNFGNTINSNLPVCLKQGNRHAFCRSCYFEYLEMRKRFAEPIQLTSLGKLMAECRIIAQIASKTAAENAEKPVESQESIKEYFNGLAEAILDTFPDMKLENPPFVEEILFVTHDKKHPALLDGIALYWIVKYFSDDKIINIWKDNTSNFNKNVNIFSGGKALQSKLEVYKLLCSGYGITPKQEWIQKLGGETQLESSDKDDIIWDLVSQAVMDTFPDVHWTYNRNIYFGRTRWPQLSGKNLLQRFIKVYGEKGIEYYLQSKLAWFWYKEDRNKLYVYELLCKDYGIAPRQEWIDKINDYKAKNHVQ